MAAAHLSSARVLALAAATLTLCGHKVAKDSLGGTMTQATAVGIMETELALAEGELQTDHEPFLRIFEAGATGINGPYNEVLALKQTRAVAIHHG